MGAGGADQRSNALEQLLEREGIARQSLEARITGVEGALRELRTELESRDGDHESRIRRVEEEVQGLRRELQTHTQEVKGMLQTLMSQLAAQGTAIGVSAAAGFLRGAPSPSHPDPAELRGSRPDPAELRGSRPDPAELDLRLPEPLADDALDRALAPARPAPQASPLPSVVIARTDRREVERQAEVGDSEPPSDDAALTVAGRKRKASRRALGGAISLGVLLSMVLERLLDKYLSRLIP